MIDNHPRNVDSHLSNYGKRINLEDLIVDMEDQQNKSLCDKYCLRGLIS